jgi:hypothetical protein
LIKTNYVGSEPTTLANNLGLLRKAILNNMFLDR